MTAHGEVPAGTSRVLLDRPLLTADQAGALLGGIPRFTVLQMARDVPALGRPIGRDCDVIGAEILYAARMEMAVKLGDALIRRTEAGAAGHPGSDAVERAGAIMARTHEWDEWRMRNEIAEVEAFYRLPRD